MTKEAIRILIFVAVFFLSCKPHSTQNETILRAESLLDSSPDSAYRLLSSIHAPEKLSEADYAAWCLHYTHVLYKLNKLIASDSLINVSVNYYKDSPFTTYSGRAYYLLGCISEMQQKNENAMIAYKQAKYLLQQTNEYKLKGLIDFNIGYIYLSDEYYKQALEYFKESLKQYHLLKNTHDQACVLNTITETYIQLNYPFDTVMHYSNKALKLALKDPDPTLYYTIISRQGELLYKKDYVQSKELLLRGFKFLPQRRPELAAYLSYAYSRLHKPDSASYYFHQTFTDTLNLKTNTLISLAGAYISKNNGNNNKAFEYFENAFNNRELELQKSIRSRLYHIDKEYDMTQKKQENAALLLDNRNKVILITVLIIVVLIVFIVLLLISSMHKKQKMEHALEKQRLEYEVRTEQFENERKREKLLSKLQNRIENTLRINHLKVGLLLEGKHDDYMQEIAIQSIIAEKEWQFYIDEVNEIFDGKITKLSNAHSELTPLDLIVISFICLEVDITDCCSLLSLTKNTMYVRRKRIKRRIGIDRSIELEEWLR